jgi:hypothetical protein
MKLTSPEHKDQFRGEMKYHGQVFSHGIKGAKPPFPSSNHSRAAACCFSVLIIKLVNDRARRFSA